MSFSFPAMENKILEFWKTEEIFKKSLDKTQEGEPFVFYDGPPFATGLPHHGHLVASTIKDVIPRYQTMLGKHVDRRWGWDCHGLPIEHEINNQHGLSAEQAVAAFGIKGYNDKCRAIIDRYAKDWERIITRFGRWVDFDRTYRTCDTDYMNSVWWVFSQLWEKGLVYQGTKVMPYSTALGTALSNFEANSNYKKVRDTAIGVLFKLEEKYDGYIAAYTTTPWTVPANLGLCVNPDDWYVQVNDRGLGKKVFLSEQTLRRARDRHRLTMAPGRHPIVYARVKGSELIGLRYSPPIDDLKVDHPKAYLIHGDHYVDTYEGTGVVHLAPSFGEDDSRIMKREGGPTELCHIDQYGNIVGLSWSEKAKVRHSTGVMATRLADLGCLWFQEATRHNVPCCPRTDTRLIYKSIPCWYIKTESLRNDFVGNNKDIRWVPSHIGRGRFGNWIGGAKDWCVSRDRVWGTPIPVWVNDVTGNTKCVGSRQMLAELTGTEALDDLHRENVDDLTFSLPGEEGVYKRIPEVFDCWFESGSMPYAQVGYPESGADLDANFPADFIAEGIDQTRGWFYTLHALATALHGKPAYKNVVVNGIVQAEDGQKMSKRLRNYTSPEKIMEKYGADALRLYLLSSSVMAGESVSFSDGGVKGIVKSVLIPWQNAIKFFQTYADIDGWNTEHLITNSDNPLDVWILAETNELVAKISEELSAYNLQNVTSHVHSFLDCLTNWYIRLNRRRFWGEGLDDDKKHAYSTLYTVLETFAKVMAPVAPFSAEHFYQAMSLYGKQEQESIHLCSWPAQSEELTERQQALLDQVRTMREVILLARNRREVCGIKAKQPLSRITLIHYDGKIQDLSDVMGYIQAEANVKSVCHIPESNFYLSKVYTANYDTIHEDIPEDYVYTAANFFKYITSAQLEILKRDGQYNIGDGIIVAPKHFLVIRQPKSTEVNIGKRISIILNTRVTSELRREYRARETVSKIQKHRKNKGFEITDRVVVHYVASSNLVAAIKDNDDYISKETLSSLQHYPSVKELKLARGKEAVTSPVDIDGQILYFSLEKSV